MAPRGESRPWLAPLLIVVVTIVAFLPSVTNGFVSWDDQKNFLDNPHYRGLGPSQLGWMWTTFHLGHYVPLSWMTLGLDYALWGMAPAGYHLTSILFHAANAALVYLLAIRLFRLVDSEWAPRRIRTAATIAALFFAVHPLRVESVAWVTERRDTLSLFFYLLVLLAYLRFRSAENASPGWYWASIGLFACALLSKATAMTAPAILLLLEIYPLRRVAPPAGWWTRETRRTLLELLPFAMLSAAIVVLSLIALHPPAQLPLGDKLVVSSYSLAFYVWKTVVPTGLSPLYQMPIRVNSGEARFIAGYCGVAVLAGAIAWLWRRRRGVAVALAAFVIVTLPMLGVVQNGPQIAADRYTYHAAPALSLLLAASILVWRPWRAIAAAAAVVILALGSLTWAQIAVWHDTESLWSRVLEQDPDSPMGHSAMATLLYSRGRIEEALEHSRRAVALAPDFAQAHNDLGVGLARIGRSADAVAEFRRSIALEPTYDEAHSNLGVELAREGDLDGAVAEYRRALALNADDADAHVDLGNVYVRRNQFDAGIAEYQAALTIRPAHADAELNWGVALARQGRFADAVAHFRAALAIDSTNAEARDYLEKAARLSRPAGPNTP